MRKPEKIAERFGQLDLIDNPKQGGSMS